jgi:hypothetical protein
VVVVTSLLSTRDLRLTWAQTGKIAYLPLTNLPSILPITRRKAKIRHFRPFVFAVFVANVAILTGLDKTEKNYGFSFSSLSSSQSDRWRKLNCRAATNIL